MAEPIRVLVADDDDEVRVKLRYVLAYDPRFHLVGEAYDGRSTMRGLETDKPDIIVLDLVMPNMDGYHALPMIKRQAPNAKVLIHTGAEIDPLALTYQGADGFKDKTDGIDPYAIAEMLVGICSSAAF